MNGNRTVVRFPFFFVVAKLRVKSEESRIRGDFGDKNKKAMTFTGDRSLLNRY